jgi:phosphomannomutase
VKEIVRKTGRHIPTILGAVVGGFIMHYREIIFEVLHAVAEAPPRTRSDIPPNALIVDEDLLREVREDGAILVYRTDGDADHFAVVRDPDKY